MRFHYLAAELLALGAVLVLFGEIIDWRQLTRRVALQRYAIIAVAWLVIEQIAVSHNLWTFPARGTLTVRILGLPLEELAFLPTHVFFTAVFTQFALRTSEGGRA